MTDQTNKQLEDMSMPELWAEAKRLGVDKSGKKDELIARLQEAQEEGGEPEPMPKNKGKNQTPPAVAAPKEQVYISRYNELRLVMKSSYNKEVGGRVVAVSGQAIQFHEGAFRTSDPTEIAFLDNHKNCGSVFTKIERKDQNKAVDEVIAKRYEDLEAREKKVAAKEAEIERKEMAKKGQEEGAGKPKAVSGIRSTAQQPKF